MKVGSFLKYFCSTQIELGGVLYANNIKDTAFNGFFCESSSNGYFKESKTWSPGCLFHFEDLNLNQVGNGTTYIKVGTPKSTTSKYLSV